MKVFKCELCGKMLMTMIDSGCIPHCCGKEMTLLKAGATDGALEKHVPVVSAQGGIVTVEVGEAEHPMMDAHYIQFIILETKSGFQYAELEPGQEPKAVFKAADPVAAYEYCNLHGFWKADI